MKNYIPIIVGILVILGAGVFIRQYAARTSFTPPSSGSPSVSETGIQEDPQAGENTPVPARASALSLTVLTPANNATVGSSPVTVTGKTAANAEVFVNDVETKADANGNFSVSLSLDEGDNYILVAANDANGNFVEKELTVTFSPT